MNPSVRIKVVGVGGGGVSAIDRMAEDGFANIDLIAANTDLASIDGSGADMLVQLGSDRTMGLGAGGDPKVGQAAALSSEPALVEALSGADLVFIGATLGGGTGSGAAPVIAAVARSLGALTVGVVTLPFPFEGRRRQQVAAAALEALGAEVDAVVTIDNTRLLALDDDLTMATAFQKADEVLVDAVAAISDLLVREGVINLDFADVSAVLSGSGSARIGVGRGRGANRCRDAVDAALCHPLLDEAGIAGATGVLLNVVAGESVGLREVAEAASHVEGLAHEDAEILFGLRTDPDFGEEVEITLVATGFEEARAAAHEVARVEQAPALVPERAWPKGRRNALRFLG